MQQDDGRPLPANAHIKGRTVGRDLLRLKARRKRMHAGHRRCDGHEKQAKCQQQSIYQNPRHSMIPKSAPTLFRRRRPARRHHP